MVDIRCYAHEQLQGDISLHVIVNIIKFKRMHGLNYLSFGEQRFFKIMLILHVWFPSDGEGGRELKQSSVN